MGYRFPRTETFRCLLSLLVLTASVGAPLQTDTSGRTLHFSPHKRPARSAVVRVRALSDGRTFRGFRAVVGVAGGRSEPRAGREHPFDPGTHISTSASAALLSCHHGGAARLSPPLRC
jgi:hypothetical protein